MILGREDVVQSLYEIVCSSRRLSPGCPLGADQRDSKHPLPVSQERPNENPEDCPVEPAVAKGDGPIGH